MTKGRRRSVRPIAITASLVAPRAPMVGRQAVQQMADDFRVIATREGNVTEDDMSLIGWTPTQIALHGRAARDLATSLSTVAV